MDIPLHYAIFSVSMYFEGKIRNMKDIISNLVFLNKHFSVENSIYEVIWESTSLSELIS